MTVDVPAEQPRSDGMVLMLVALVVAEITCALEFSMVNVALAHLYGVYGSPARVGWLITAFSLTSAAGAAVCSRLGDLFGHKRVLLLMLATALTGSLISSMAGSLELIIFGRALQGASMSALPLAFGILRTNVRPDRLTIGVGVLGGAYSFGVGAGTIIGGLVVDNLNWQNLFLFSGGTAAAAFLLCWRLIPTSLPRPRQGSLDLLGGVLFIVPIAALLLGMTNIKFYGWASPASTGLIAASLAAFVLWVRHELRQPNPLIDVRLFKRRDVALANATVFFTTIGPLMYSLVLMPLMQQPLWTGVGLGLSATMVGILKAPTNISAGVAASGVGFAARRYGMRPFIIGSAALNVLVWLVVIAKHDSAWILVAGAVAVMAPAGTVIFACTPAIIMQAVSVERTSEATGLTQVIRAVGLAVGSQLIAITLSTSSIADAHGKHFPNEAAYVVTFIAICLCAAVSLVTAWAIPRRPSGSAA